MTAPAKTSDAQCTLSFIRAKATDDAMVYATVGTSQPLLWLATADAIANAFVAWPEGNDSCMLPGSKSCAVLSSWLGRARPKPRFTSGVMTPAAMIDDST